MSFAAVDKSVVGSAPRRRESSVEEESTRRVVPTYCRRQVSRRHRRQHIGSSRGSLGDVFERYRETDAWKSKAPKTRAEWEAMWRKYIGPIFWRLAMARGLT